MLLAASSRSWHVFAAFLAVLRCCWLSLAVPGGSLAVPGSLAVTGGPCYLLAAEHRCDGARGCQTHPLTLPLPPGSSWMGRPPNASAEANPQAKPKPCTAECASRANAQRLGRGNSHAKPEPCVGESPDASVEAHPYAKREPWQRKTIWQKSCGRMPRKGLRETLNPKRA